MVLLVAWSLAVTGVLTTTQTVAVGSEPDLDPAREVPVTVEALDQVVAPGAQVWLTASGFDPGEKVRVEIAGVRTGGALNGLILTDQTGASSGQVAVPAKNPAGTNLTDLPQPLTLKVTGQTTGRTATGTVQVKEMWAANDYSALGNPVNPTEDTLTPHTVDGLQLDYELAISDRPMGSMIAYDGVIYVGVTRGDRGGVLALDAATGEDLWFQTGQGIGPTGLAISGDGRWVYQGGSYVTAALNAKTGELKWVQYGGVNFGTPRVVGDLLIINRGDPELTTALNRHTGEVVWDKQDEPGSDADGPRRVDSVSGVTVADGIVYQPGIRGSGPHYTFGFRADTGKEVPAAEPAPGGSYGYGWAGAATHTDKYMILRNTQSLLGYQRRTKKWLFNHNDIWVWPYVISPVVGDILYAATTHQPSRRDGTLIARNLATNQTLWKRTDFGGGTSYAGLSYANGVLYGLQRLDDTSPYPPAAMAAVDATTGKTLWTSAPLATYPNGNEQFNTIPIILDGHLYAGTDRGHLLSWSLPDEGQGPGVNGQRVP